MNKFLRSSLLVLLVFSFASHVFAVQAQKVDSSGKLSLDNGKVLQLAGLVLSEEAITALSIIIAGKDLEIDEEPALTGPAGISFAYVRVKTTEIDFPFHSSTDRREQKVMVNELLIQFGLAKAVRDGKYKHQANFEALEEIAKKDGKGIWSYEKIGGKKKPESVVSPDPSPEVSPAPSPETSVIPLAEVPKALSSEIVPVTVASPSPSPSPLL